MKIIKDSKYSGNTDFLSLLTIIFIVLKLTGLIDWNWFAVLIPLWVELGIIISICLFFYLKNKIF